ncbi:MAG: GNAT family N-acetyltransferase [Anaerolineae bacterium]|nr:GNAT family N-acetyltransferase [Anaerolineae bacterium]
MTDLIIRSATPDDWPTIAAITIRTFGPEDEHNPLAESFLQHWLNMPNRPDFIWENTRIGLVNDQIVAHVGIVERVLRIGSVNLTFGGIAAVLTLPEYRKRGYAAQLLQDAIRRMHEVGYDLSLLTGIPRFYDQFGFVVVWPRRDTTFRVEDALRIPPEAADGYTVRPATEDDTPDILACYDREWHTRPCGARRTLDWMRWRLNCTPPGNAPYVVVVENPNGVLCGYSAGWKPDQRAEVIAVDRPATAALLRHNASLFTDKPDTVIRWQQMTDSRAARYARQLCTVCYEIIAVHRGDWMARFIDTQSALDTLRPAFVERLRQHHGPDADALTLKAGADTVTLHMGSSDITLPHTLFLPLLFGSLSANDIDDLPDHELKQPQRNVLKQLFPPAISGLAGLDWF